jgi:hypothetical protein
MIYKVSYVVIGGKHPGAIMNQTQSPEVGDHIIIGPDSFEVVEVREMMAPREDFQFLHATIRQISAEESANNKKAKGTAGKSKAKTSAKNRR